MIHRNLRIAAILVVFAACKDGPPPVVVPIAPTSDGNAASPSAASANAVPEAGAPSPIMLTLEDSGKSLALPIGALLAVKLRTNAGNGFLWEISQNDPKVLAPSGEPTTERLDEAEAGERIRRVFTFVAKAPGATHLDIVLHRPWEKAPPMRTFAIDVTVK